MKRKLRTRRGETLAETLVAVLVVGMSILILYGLVSASMSINARAREMDTGDNGLYPVLADVETHAFTAGDSAVTIKTTGGPTAVTFSDTHSYTRTGANGLTVYGKEG